jgi:hypothetical protein
MPGSIATITLRVAMYPSASCRLSNAHFLPVYREIEAAESLA